MPHPVQSLSYFSEVYQQKKELLRKREKTTVLLTKDTKNPIFFSFLKNTGLHILIFLLVERGTGVFSDHPKKAMLGVMGSA